MSVSARTPARRRPGVAAAVAAAVAGLALVVAAAGCGDDPAPAPPPGPAVRTGTHEPEPPPPDPEASRKLADDHLKALDEEAHRLVSVFRSRVHEPWRDDGLQAADGRIELEVDGRRGVYGFAFDAAQKDDAQVTITVVREDEGLHPGAAKQAKRFAILAVRGPASQVLSYTPPVRWHCVSLEDGRKIVVMPPHRGPASTSYSIGGNGLVELSGTTDGKTSSRTTFHWTDWKGRSVLSRSVEDDGKATLAYEYGEESGVLALRRAVLTEGVHRCAADVSWTRIERR